MPKRDWIGKAVDGTMQYITERDGNGETIGGTTEDDMHEEKTTVLPEYIDKNDFSENELAILRQTLLNYQANNKEIAEMVGLSQPVVSKTFKKFIREYEEEIKSNNTKISPHYDSVLYLKDNPDATKGEVEDELGLSFGSNGWAVVKSTFSKMTGKKEDQIDSEEAERERIYEYFKENPNASLDDAVDSVETDILDRSQLRALKANAVKHSNNDTTETMNEDSTSEAVGILMDKMDAIDEIEDELEDMKRTLQVHGNSIDKLVDKTKDETDSKRYVGDNPTVTLELTEFEAMFIANRLWEAGEMHNEVGEERTESEAKWWARKIHGERNTRKD